MPFNRPTLPQLVDRIQQDFVSKLQLVSPLLRRSVVYVFGRVVAGAAHMLHGHLEYLSHQIFPDQSDDAFLVRQAAIFGLSKTPATFAQGNIVCTGTNGTLIPATTLWQRSDGVEYSVDADTTIASGTATVAVTAVLAGAAGSTDPFVDLSIESPIAGVNATASVDSGGLNGSDQESTDGLRSRLLTRLQEPPHGGDADDYVAWALEVSGVTRAWVYPLENGAGTVVVRFVRDNDSGSIFPDSGEVSDVQTFIDSVAPVTAIVTVEAPVGDVLNYTISITPDTADTRAAVTAALIDMHRRDAQPGVPTRVSRIEVAIGTAAGIEDFTLTSPSSDVSHATGHMAQQGTITWV